MKKKIKAKTVKAPETTRVFAHPASMRDVDNHYCAGCGHGIIHRLICEVIDELGIREKVIAVAPVGCAVIAYDYWNFDVTEAPHGRTPAVATGIKRVRPNNIVFTYQGDGDLAAIGTAETIHAANRGENITIIFVNNGVYGMTGGQMAPTTLLGQTSTTTPPGRSALLDGHPIHFSEILGQLPGTMYIERCAVNTPANIMKAKKAVKKAFQYQMDNVGFSLIEILSQCPTNWKMSPIDACRWVNEVMTKEYPLGIIKDCKR